MQILSPNVKYSFFEKKNIPPGGRADGGFPSCFGLGVLNNRQLIKGSYTNASNTAINDSLFLRMTRITFSQVILKVPSIPLTYTKKLKKTPNEKTYLHGIDQHSC